MSKPASTPKAKKGIEADSLIGDQSPIFETIVHLSDAELYEALVAWQAARNSAFPHRNQHDVHIETERPIVIAFPSDWHIGGQGVNHSKLRADCQLIANTPNVYCAVGGDPVDNFIIGGKMLSASRTQVAQVDVQWQLFRYLVELLHEQKSLLWVSGGNHDQWTQSASGIDGIEAALQGVPHLNTQEGALLHLHVGPQAYTIYRKHRPVRFTSSFNNTHFLKQMLRFGTVEEFDIGISEHFHKASTETIEYRPGSHKERVLICCGSYKEVDDYAESIAEYGTGGAYVPSVVLYPDRRKIVPFLDLNDAILHLAAWDATHVTLAAPARR